MVNTEVMKLTKKMIVTVISLSVGGVLVQIKGTTKYMVIIIDMNLSFWAQICMTSDKAAKIKISVIKLVANANGSNARSF